MKISSKLSRVEALNKLLNLTDAIWRELSTTRVYYDIGKIFLNEERKFNKSSPFLMLAKDCFSGGLICSISKIIRNQKDSCSIKFISDYINSNIKNLSLDKKQEIKFRKVINDIRLIENEVLFKEIFNFRDNMGAHLNKNNSAKGSYIKLIYNVYSMGRFIKKIENVLKLIYEIIKKTPNNYYKGNFGDDLKKIINFYTTNG